jgi:hypothetical protein
MLLKKVVVQFSIMFVNYELANLNLVSRVVE